MDKQPNDFDRLCIEVGKLRIEINDIRDNHLKHLRNNINLLFVLVGLGLAETGVVIAMVALWMVR